MERFVRERPKNSSLPRAEFLNTSVPRVGVPEIGHAGESRAFPIGKDAVSNSVWIYVPKASGAEAVRDAKRLTELLNSPLYAKISRAYSNGFRLEKHEIDSFPFVPASRKAGSIME